MKRWTAGCAWALAAALATGCGDDSSAVDAGGSAGSGDDSASSTTSVGTTTPTTSTTSTGTSTTSTTTDGTGAGTMGCEPIDLPAAVPDLPIDIVLLVDTSASMIDNVFDTQTALDAFGPQLVGAGLDVRVLLVSQLDGFATVCANPPLGGGGCPLDDSNPPLLTRIDADTGVSGFDPLDGLVEQLQTPAVTALLRTGAHKHLAVISDADTAQTALGFDTTITGLGGDFPYYRFSGTFGGAGGSGCEPAPILGQIAMLTGGASSPLCPADFSATWDALSRPMRGCTVEVPDGPGGASLSTVAIDVGGGAESLTAVADLSACTTATEEVFVDDAMAPTQASLCPATCRRFQDAATAEVRLLFDCPGG